ncbi:MAG: FHA domain-containing protein [Pleurocapsa minor GSE-CHR-MK-17-07R]|jgi:pSer/pThr/pTyr-binding forkhead associated (FHA) protein|nr:FHA domain-containing protein [Pleurocapsa minor GSE-CHR-MK 17-07R]
MPDNSERPILIFRGDNGSNQQWTLQKDELILGRDETCDIVVPERNVSRQHVRLFRQGDAFYIEDLESRNGSWVNDEPLRNAPRKLYDNDIITLATVAKLQFVGSGATAPLPFEVPASVTDGRLRLDRAARRVFINGAEVEPPLSPPQYRLLELLYLNAGRVCTRDEVVQTVWPDVFGEGVSEQAIDALVRRLRDRLSDLDPDWEYIITVRGHGFRLENA